MTWAQRLRAFGSHTQSSLDAEVARVNARLREHRERRRKARRAARWQRVVKAVGWRRREGA